MEQETKEVIFNYQGCAYTCLVPEEAALRAEAGVDHFYLYLKYDIGQF